jgi:hypothetical protein
MMIKYRVNHGSRVYTYGHADALDAESEIA